MKFAAVVILSFAAAAIAINTESKKQIKLPNRLTDDTIAAHGLTDDDLEHPLPDQMSRRGGGGKGGKGGAPPPPPPPSGWGWSGPPSGGWGSPPSMGWGGSPMTMVLPIPMVVRGYGGGYGGGYSSGGYGGSSPSGYGGAMGGADASSSM